MTNTGWIIIHRKLLESEIWEKPNEWLKIWIYILLNVSYEDKRYKRGTYFFRFEWIAKATNTTFDQVRRCVEYLKISHSIATQKATQGIIISVLNYAKYQDKEKDESQTENPEEAKQKPRGSHNTSNNITSKQIITPSGEKFKPMFKEEIIELDESGEEITPVPSKYGNKTKLYSRLIVYYKELTNEPAPIKRYLVAMKDIVEIADKICDTEEQVEKEIRVRIKTAFDHAKLKKYHYPSLENLIKKWNDIPNLKKEICQNT